MKKVVVVTRVVFIFGVALAGWAVAAAGNPQAARSGVHAVSSPPPSPAASQTQSAAANSEFPLGTGTPSEECGVCHEAIYREFAYGFGADLKFKSEDALAAMQADAQGPHESSIRAGEERVLYWTPALKPGRYSIRASLVYDLNRYNDPNFTEDQTTLTKTFLPLKVAKGVEQ